MPPTLDAAATTDAYRAELLRLRNAAAVFAVRGFDEIDLDVSEHAIASQLRAWSSEAASFTETAQARAQQLAAGYVPAYLAAADVADEGPSPDPRPTGAIGARSLPGAYRSAGWAMLWQLGRGAGRSAAIAYGGAVTMRTARTAVSEAAREQLAQTIAVHPEIVGYSRVTAARCCERCFSHAGQLYHDRHGFYAHPSCHCTAEPVIRDVPERVKRTTATVVQP